MTTTVNVRRVDTHDRIEFHTATCRHHIPTTATVSNDTMPADDLRVLYWDCVVQGTQQVIMPCVQHVTGAGGPS